MAIWVFLVYWKVCIRFSEAQQIVEDTARQNYSGNCVWLLRHGGQEASESIGGNAKRILHHSSGSGQSVVEHAL